MPLLLEFEGKFPQVHPDAWIAPNATLVGDVVVEAQASIWFGTVVRADVAPIHIGRRSNIQDNCTLHAGYDSPLTVEDDVTVGHGCVLHCTRIGSNALIGNNAVVLDGATVGPRSVVSAGAVVGPGFEVPSGVIVGGQPAKVLKEVSGSSAEMWLEHNAAFYEQLAKRHEKSHGATTTPPK